MATQQWYSAKELAGLPGMPGTQQNVTAKAKRENWQRRKRAGRGGGWEYHISSLPKETQDALLDKMIAALPEPVCSLPATSKALPPIEAENLPKPASLAKWQRDTMDARLAILSLVDALARTTSLNKAINKVVAMARHEMLPPHIQALVPVANARSGKGGGKRTLSRRTLFRWRELRGIGTTALAPSEPPKQDLPPWADYLLQCYRVPQKISVNQAREEMAKILPKDIPMPSESQCRRLLKKLSVLEREKGRRTGNNLRALKPYRMRDTSDLEPLEVCLCDGHSYKAYIAHPVHGRPFHPEVCAVLDAATRKALGWSAGLAESAETVADALRHAIANHGIPKTFYTDPGAGNKAAVNAHPSFGRYYRLGMNFMTGQVGNAQARGLIERFQASCWIRSAKLLPTYSGKDLDSAAAHKLGKLMVKERKRPGISGIVPSWRQFLDHCAQAIEDYNNRPHSALPKITDASGQRRHMTPNEMWQTFVAKGWKPDVATADEIADMFRPRVEVTTRRGQVRLFGNTYVLPGLEHHHGERVFVEYEPQDGRYVYVRDLEERLLGIAEFEKNKTRYVPVSATEHANNLRAERRDKLLRNKRELVELERRGVVEIEPATISLDQARLIAEQALADPARLDVPDISTDAAAYADWKRLDARLKAGEELTEQEKRRHAGFMKTAAWRAQKALEEDFAEFYAQK